MAASLFGVGVVNYDKVNLQQDNDGAAATPALTFGDADTGLYATAVGEVLVSVAGSLAATFNATGLTVVGSVVIGSAALTEAELELLDGITAGTSAASKALVLDASGELDNVGVLKAQETLITNLQVLALNATPITVISAPAAGVRRIFEGADVFLDYGTGAFVADAGEDVVIQKAGGGDVVSNAADSTLFTGTADTLVRLNRLSDSDASTVDDVAAAAGYEITILVGEWITGDSVLKVRAYYRDIADTSMEAIS
jgi:hypothetical protein